MKKIILTFVVSVLFATTAFAAQIIKTPIRTCFMQTQFFKFKNNDNYKSDQFAVYTEEQNFNTKTNLATFTVFPAGPGAESQLYTNVFLSNQSIIAGATDFVKSQQKVKSLCGITFVCDCSGGQCENVVTTAGPGCSIDGNGTLTDPFIFTLAN